MTEHRYDFASDNTAGVVPEALAAWQAANEGFAAGYGEDEWSRRAKQAVVDFFEHECEVFFVLTGTAANALAFSHYAKPFESVLVQRFAHAETDECNAPEFFGGGLKLIGVEGVAGRLDPDRVAERIEARPDVHSPRVALVSITSPTEVGTVYSLEHIEALAQIAHAHDAKLHLDGARFANGVVSLDTTPAEMTWKRGVDAVSFGATKNGLPFGEALVFFEPKDAEGFAYRHKMAAQLASKGRFLTAPFALYLESGAWRRSAENANARARELGDKLRGLGLEPAYDIDANTVFVRVDKAVTERLNARGWHAYDDVDPGGALRFACSWRTNSESIDELIRDLGEVLR